MKYDSSERQSKVVEIGDNPDGTKSTAYRFTVSKATSSKTCLCLMTANSRHNKETIKKVGAEKILIITQSEIFQIGLMPRKYLAKKRMRSRD